MKSVATFIDGTHVHPTQSTESNNFVLSATDATTLMMMLYPWKYTKVRPGKRAAGVTRVGGRVHIGQKPGTGATSSTKSNIGLVAAAAALTGEK